MTTWGGARRRLLPQLAGVGRDGHVALTFDDGPDPVSTPSFLKALDDLGVRGTFFLLGDMVARAPGLAREISAAGHEVAVHGWDHRSLLLHGPHQTMDGLRRARDTIGEAAQPAAPPAWFRPPYGILSAAGLLASRRAHLQPVLWTAWGVDWTVDATGESVLDRLTPDLAGGATVLLHDSDCTSAPGAWRSTLAALPELVGRCQAAGWRVGPLREHGLAQTG